MCNIYILLNVLLCSIAEYFWELCRIIFDDSEGQFKVQTRSKHSQRYLHTTKCSWIVIPRTKFSGLFTRESRLGLFCRVKFQVSLFAQAKPRHSSPQFVNSTTASPF